MQVAGEALIATEQDLRAKIRGLDEEIADKRDLLGDLMKRHDDAAAELAGADANLHSAGAESLLSQLLSMRHILYISPESTHQDYHRYEGPELNMRQQLQPDRLLLSAGALLDNAKAHLALKVSLLFEKETLIANFRKKASAAEKGEGGSRLWNIFGRRNSASVPPPQPEKQSTWREL